MRGTSITNVCSYPLCQICGYFQSEKIPQAVNFFPVYCAQPDTLPGSTAVTRSKMDMRFATPAVMADSFALTNNSSLPTASGALVRGDIAWGTTVAENFAIRASPHAYRLIKRFSPYVREICQRAFSLILLVPKLH